MEVSVVIVSYNVSSYLDQALTTLREALEGIEAEVFVVDNASSDDSVAMVRQKYPWVTLIANDRNLGFARANNQALVRARGEFVLLLNPDTVLRRDTIATMISFFREHPEAGAAGCRVLNPDGSLQLACRRGFPTPGVAFFKMVGLADLFPRSRTFGAYNLTYLDPDQLTEVDAVSGSFLMARKEVLDRVGYLDEDFFMYGEDLDFCYRVKQAGWKIFYVPWTEIIHFKGESTKTVPTMKSIRDFYTAMHIFTDKHFDGRSVPRWLLNAGIYGKMVQGIMYSTLRYLWQPSLDLLLLNFSLILSILLRFGIDLETAPAYTGPQWVSVFVVYSLLYLGTFYGTGMYHRFRGNPERAILAISIGFLFNIFVVYFIKQYNFSRIASFYSWGFNTLFISGWRFAIESIRERAKTVAGRPALVVGSLDDAGVLRDILAEQCPGTYDIVGSLGVEPDTIRGTERDGLHVLGLIEDLNEVVRDYAIEVVFMVGRHIPFSTILSNGSRRGFQRPEFKFIPELKSKDGVEKNIQEPIPMIDIHTGRFSGTPRRY
ncbi:glycosyltransferase [Candidatus Latescibacterota bacterium]